MKTNNPSCAVDGRTREKSLSVVTVQHERQISCFVVDLSQLWILHGILNCIRTETLQCTSFVPWQSSLETGLNWMPLQSWRLLCCIRRVSGFESSWCCIRSGQETGWNRDRKNSWLMTLRNELNLEPPTPSGSCAFLASGAVSALIVGSRNATEKSRGHTGALGSKLPERTTLESTDSDRFTLSCVATLNNNDQVLHTKQRWPVTFWKKKNAQYCLIHVWLARSPTTKEHLRESWWEFNAMPFQWLTWSLRCAHWNFSREHLISSHQTAITRPLHVRFIRDFTSTSP